VDEWLLATAELPLLRVYRWLGDWVSYGYSLDEAEARRHFSDPGLSYVRRWTGGGVVDHRSDWTYSVVIPAGDPLAGKSAPERYLAIHVAVVATLVAEGISATLSRGTTATGSEACFENPVTSDVTDAAGCKLGGAGQRRTHDGVLHQGSVLTKVSGPAPEDRGGQLASRLGSSFEVVELAPDSGFLAEAVQARYGNPAWSRHR